MIRVTVQKGFYKASQLELVLVWLAMKCIMVFLTIILKAGYNYVSVHVYMY